MIGWQPAGNQARTHPSNRAVSYPPVEPVYTPGGGVAEQPVTGSILCMRRHGLRMQKQHSLLA